MIIIALFLTFPFMLLLIDSLGLNMGEMITNLSSNRSLHLLVLYLNLSLHLVMTGVYYLNNTMIYRRGVLKYPGVMNYR